MTIAEAITKAIEGGWKPIGQKFSSNFLSYKVQAINKVKFKERFFLDPLFWQSLGKESIDSAFKKYPKALGTRFTPWKDEWTRFIDHLAGGRTAESFFEELLK